MIHLLKLNDPPYSTERCSNGLRMVHALAKHYPEIDVTVLLMTDVLLDPVPLRKGSQALLTIVYCSTDRLCRFGAPM
jgi:sulfur relay (sulfurtransferase) complex TusBCD TusD component (DsrE family)